MKEWTGHERAEAIRRGHPLSTRIANEDREDNGECAWCNETNTLRAQVAALRQSFCEKHATELLAEPDDSGVCIECSEERYARLCDRSGVEVATLRAALMAQGKMKQFRNQLCWCRTADGHYCVGQPQCEQAKQALGAPGGER